MAFTRFLSRWLHAGLDRRIKYVVTSTHFRKLWPIPNHKLCCARSTFVAWGGGESRSSLSAAGNGAACLELFRSA